MNFLENEARAGSELARLSSDPALALHPDPTFHAQFRDADETDYCEADFAEFSKPPAPPTWVAGVACRRAAKE
jgi:hypothetical protein